MRHSRLITAALIALSLVYAAAKQAIAADPNITVTTSVEQTHNFDPATIEKFPAVEEKVSFLTAHGPEQATYTGALLWSVIDSAAMLHGDRPARLRRTIWVTGRDDYTVVLALAEIDPEFEGKQVLLAYRRDGKPIDGNTLRLVVPGDRHGGRSVRDVVRIDVH